MYCRQWHSEMEWESRLYTTLEREQNNIDTDIYIVIRKSFIGIVYKVNRERSEQKYPEN